MKGIAMRLSRPRSIASKLGVMVIATTIGTVVVASGPAQAEPAQAEYRRPAPVAGTVRTPSPQARQTLDRLQATLPSGAPNDTGPVRIVNQFSQKCLNVWNASIDNFAQVIQYTCESSVANDVWWLYAVSESGGSTAYHVVNDYSGKCLNVWNASPNDYALVIQYTCGAEAKNDQWTIIDESGGVFRLQNYHSKKCLNVWNASPNNYAKVIQYTCGSPVPNDVWTLS